MCILSLMNVFFISLQYEMDLIWMELRTTPNWWFGKWDLKDSNSKMDETIGHLFFLNNPNSM